MAYNGWTNKETWLVNLWVDYSDVEMHQDGIEMDPSSIEAYVWEIIPTIECHFTADLLACAMGKVNWHELAEHFSEELEA